MVVPATTHDLIGLLAIRPKFYGASLLTFLQYSGAGLLPLWQSRHFFRKELDVQRLKQSIDFFPRKWYIIVTKGKGIQKMIIRERIEREISFSSEEVEAIRKFRDFLQNFSDEEWEVLEKEFKGNEYTDENQSDMNRLFDLVDDFYIFAKIN